MQQLSWREDGSTSDKYRDYPSHVRKCIKVWHRMRRICEDCQKDHPQQQVLPDSAELEGIVHTLGSHKQLLKWLEQSNLRSAVAVFDDLRTQTSSRQLIKRKSETKRGNNNESQQQRNLPGQPPEVILCLNSEKSVRGEMERKAIARAAAAARAASPSPRSPTSSDTSSVECSNVVTPASQSMTIRLTPPPLQQESSPEARLKSAVNTLLAELRRVMQDMAPWIDQARPNVTLKLLVTHQMVSLFFILTLVCLSLFAFPAADANNNKQHYIWWIWCAELFVNAIWLNAASSLPLWLLARCILMSGCSWGCNCNSGPQLTWKARAIYCISSLAVACLLILVELHYLDITRVLLIVPLCHVGISMFLGGLLYVKVREERERVREQAASG
jgi:hypothetical protein